MEHSWNKSLSIIKLIHHTSAIHILHDRLGTNSLLREWLNKLLGHSPIHNHAKTTSTTHNWFQ